MAILQISKIQQRSGNLVDLPQLDEAEFGWANDAKRLFIGKTSPNENIEILTSYSTISFSQLDGAVGNLNISNLTVGDGQLLVFNGTDWVNRGGNVGGLITLGDVSNVKITGGAIGYVLQTDGTGNLSWTPKGTLVADILNVSKANPAVVTTVNDNFFTNGSQITILDPQGMTELAGNIYYANALTSTTFALYTDDTLSTSVNSTGYNAYSYTTVSATTVSTNAITVANSSPFTVGSAVKFIGNMSTSNISNTTTYYVLSKPNATSLKIATSPDANTSNVVPLQTTSGLSAEVYQISGQAVSTISSGVSFSPAGGTDTTVQFNQSGSLQGSSAFTFDYGTNLLTVNGNANVGNLVATGIATATRFVSNIATGTAPLTVTSTTQVANLNAATAGTAGTVTTNAQPNITSVGTLTTLTVTGNTTSGNLLATGSVIAPIISSNSNGTGNNFRVGDDAWLGDINVTNTIVLKGQQNAANGYIVFGNADTTSTLGRAGSGPLTYNGAFVAVGNITGSNLITGGLLSVTGNANVGNIGAARGVFTNIAGEGGNISNIQGANVSGTVSSATTAGTVTTNAQPNITSVGTLTSVAVTGNATAGNVYANSGTIGASLLTGTLTTAAQPNITSVGTLTSLTATGNVAGGNLTTAGVVAATGNVAGGNLTTAGVVAATGNVAGGNLTTAGVVAATGNVSGGNLTTGGVVSATGNVSGGNLTTGGVVAATGNVSGANLTATSYVIRSVNTGITAAGSTQGTATALTKEINVVSTVSSGANGVVLPSAVQGMVLIVNNTSANTLNVYPASGGAINSASANAAYSHSSGASIQYYATSGTQWYTVGATFA